MHLWQEEEAAAAKTVDPQALTVALSPAGLGAEPEVRSGLSPAATTPHHLPVTVPLTVFPRGANFPIVSQACAIFSTVQLECPTAAGETPTSARHLGGSAGFTAQDQTCLHISVTGNKGTNPCRSLCPGVSVLGPKDTNSGAVQRGEGFPTLTSPAVAASQFKRDWLLSSSLPISGTGRV